MMKRILCLWFPNWPVQRRLWVSRDAESSERSGPLVLHAPVAGKPRVTACSRTARKLGVKPGMLLAEAEALCLVHPSPPLRGRGDGSEGAAPIFEPHDSRADRNALRQLAHWCQQFTPLAAVEESESPDCLLLDVTGCGYGFGGLDGLARTAVAGLRKQGYYTTAAIADTVGAAWALAHHGIELSSDVEPRVRIVPPGGQVEAMKPLLIEALRLPAATTELLHTFDVRRIGQLLALPRGDLPCRFGPELLDRLDQALGAAPELIEPESQDDPVEASWPFDPPIADARLLDQALAYLLDRVLERLRPRQLGIQRLLCSLKLASGEPVRFPVGLARPCASFSHLLDLLRLHLERLRVTAEIADVTIHVPSFAPLEFRQNEMFAESPDSQPLADLLERLSSRLGEQAVLRPELQADAQPEFAWRSGFVFHHRDTENTEKNKRSRRLTPIRTDKHSLLSSPRLRGENSVLRPPQLQRRPVAVAVMSVVPGGPPLSFDWNRQTFRIVQSWGPERIETGWWRGDDVRRDYYQVETPSGERYWLFRRLPDERWFLHGVFA